MQRDDVDMKPTSRKDGFSGFVYAHSAAAARMAAVVLVVMLCLAGCAQTTEYGDSAFGVNLITAESLEGLILEGEGPIPARLIYRSRNTLSSEEDRLVIEAIAQELDRLVELAGRLDEAIIDEATRTGGMSPD